jgi:hypothetical protein
MYYVSANAPKGLSTLLIRKELTVSDQDSHDPMKEIVKWIADKILKEVKSEQYEQFLEALKNQRE